VASRSTQEEIPVAAGVPRSGDTSSVLPIAETATEHAVAAIERQVAQASTENVLGGAPLRVREILARQLCRAHSAPQQVVLSLAHDVDSVASPILEFSPLLTDDDLIQILCGASVEKQIAVAQRSGLGQRVGDVMAEIGDASALERWLENRTADVSEQALLRILRRFPAHEALHALMVGRPVLPELVSQRLNALASQELRRRLLARHRLPAQMGSDVVKQSQDRPHWWSRHLNTYSR
jgi:uncharacterized protein (DUF2336 family)